MPAHRTYTPQELEQLLVACRQPTLAHHPAVGLLLAMALVLENIYALHLDADDPEMAWVTEMATLCNRELLRGTAALLHHGTIAADETVN